MRIDERHLRPDANNLILVRLILASSVIYSHCWGMTARAGAMAVGAEGGGDNLAWLLGAPVSAYGVDGFFFLSGFLVYRSLSVSGSVGKFARARLVRLWPGLAAMILLVVAGGLLATSAPVGDYLTGRETLRFVGSNLSFAFGSYTLTGVSCGNAPCNVNGSLWTLPWEARAYVILALLGLAGLANRRWMLRLVLPLTFAFALIGDAPPVIAALTALLGKGVVYNLSMLDRLWTAFALGIAAYEIRERLPLSWVILAVVFMANLALQAMVPDGLAAHIRSVTIGYSALCLGFLTAPAGRAATAGWPDYSYGMYIYAFPTMMVALALLPGIAAYPLMALNVALTLPLAALSWHFVEKPALDWLRRRQRTAFETRLGAQ